MAYQAISAITITMTITYTMISLVPNTLNASIDCLLGGMLVRLPSRRAVRRHPTVLLRPCVLGSHARPYRYPVTEVAGWPASRSRPRHDRPTGVGLSRPAP